MIAREGRVRFGCWPIAMLPALRDAPVVASQNLTVLSSEVEARNWPPGVHCTRRLFLLSSCLSLGLWCPFLRSSYLYLQSSYFSGGVLDPLFAGGVATRQHSRSGTLSSELQYRICFRCCSQDLSVSRTSGSIHRGLDSERGLALGRTPILLRLL